jgi:hypothetical protein
MTEKNKGGRYTPPPGSTCASRPRPAPCRP